MPRRSSVIWKHYQPFCTCVGPALPRLVKCKYCKWGHRAGVSANATRLTNHYVDKHSSADNSVVRDVMDVDADSQAASSASTATSPGPSVSQIGSVASQQSTLAAKGSQSRLELFLDRAVNGAAASRIDRLLVLWQAVNAQSFNSTDHKLFQMFVHSLRPTYKVPSRRVRRHQMGAMYQEVKDLLKAKMSRMKHVVLVVDGWSDHQHLEVLGTVVIDVADKAGQPLLLDTSQNRRRQTKEEIQQYLDDMLALTDAAGCKVIGITTDNGANVLAGVRMVQEKRPLLSLNCFAHTTHPFQALFPLSLPNDLLPPCSNASCILDLASA